MLLLNRLLLIISLSFRAVVIADPVGVELEVVSVEADQAELDMVEEDLVKVEVKADMGEVEVAEVVVVGSIGEQDEVVFIPTVMHSLVSAWLSPEVQP